MATSASEITQLSTTNVLVLGDHLCVSLSDGREIRVPLVWFPRLLHGTESERADWRLIGAGCGIHWPQLEEDISLQNIIDGRPSLEDKLSLRRWLAERNRQD